MASVLDDNAQELSRALIGAVEADGSDGDGHGDGDGDGDGHGHGDGDGDVSDGDGDDGDGSPDGSCEGSFDLPSSSSSQPRAEAGRQRQRRRQQQQPPLRDGTVPSARINLLSTMVGGGSLSLPLAFSLAGNALLAPLALAVLAAASELCMRFLVDAGNAVSGGGGGEGEGEGDARTRRTRRRGTLPYEGIVGRALGARAGGMASALVGTVCYFATIGYAVLLRDLLEPYADYASSRWFGGDGGGGGPGCGSVPWDRGADNGPFHAAAALCDGGGGGTGGTGPTPARNAAMVLVVLAITPLCLLTSLTALRNVGNLSMAAVLVLGAVVAYRSAQCNLLPDPPPGRIRHSEDWRDYASALPPGAAAGGGWAGGWEDFVTAFPLLVSCFICHYNVPPVHNELSDPTPARVHSWLRSSTLASLAFYLAVGFAGSMYGNCTPDGHVSGNVLLDFDESDRLLLLGRTSLAVTVTLAFPMLVIPPRDILLRALGWEGNERDGDGDGDGSGGDLDDDDDDDDSYGDPFAAVDSDLPPAMSVPLLLDAQGVEPVPSPPLVWNGEEGASPSSPLPSEPSSSPQLAGTLPRAAVAFAIFWSGVAVACSVQSIDVIWGLLGSSLSLLLGFVLPCVSYLALCPADAGLGRGGGGDGEAGSAVDGGGGGSGGSVVDILSRSIGRRLKRAAAGLILAVMVPMMVVCTVSATYHTFFEGDGRNADD